MQPINLSDITAYVKAHIGTFHAKRLEKLEKLNFKEVLRRKNPYLFKAKNIHRSQNLVRHLLDAYLQSQEETLFGDFLEGVAIFVCQKVFGGVKSKTLEGIDLEFMHDGIYYIIEIKSGPNWANSSQLKKMKDNFINAEKLLLQQNKNLVIQAINGCCYGVDNQPIKDGYKKVCGQEFWELISGSPTLYTDIIDPLGHKAKEKNEAFLLAYNSMINQFTCDFTIAFCDKGEINWKRIVEFNAQKK